MQYAADDVRYLLPLAHRLLQQLPAALLRLGDLQLLLAQQGQAALQLQQKLLPGYAPFMSSSRKSSSKADESSSALAAAATAAETGVTGAAVSVDQQGLLQLLFELQLQQLPGGWYKPKFSVYMNEDCSNSSSTNSSSSSSSNSSRPAPNGNTAGSGEGVAYGTGVVDESLQSLACLLPDR